MILPQEPPPAAPRCGVAELAESRLRSNSYLALKNVSCAYADGVLTLDGYLQWHQLMPGRLSGGFAMSGVSLGVDL